MATADEDRQVLALAETWRATPDDYSSLRALRLRASGTGELIYGYGQTIYALIRCYWDVGAVGQLRLTYLESPPYQRFQGYSPPVGDNVRELNYTLTADRVTVEEDMMSNTYEFDHTLVLSAPPWPDGLNLPHEVPRVFFGLVRKAGAQEPEPDPTT